MRHILSTAMLGLMLGRACAQTALPLNVPGDEVVMRMSATGVQVYECRAAASGALAWAFKEPRAELFIDGRPVGRHFAGPSWQHADGSLIVGRVVTSMPAPRPEDIPWLRLAVASRAGEGALGAITAVQRLNTKGGVLTGTCPTTGSVLEVPYTADYMMIRGTP